MLTTAPGSEIRKNELMGASQYLCPDCRAAMAEVDRRTENGASFIWYECTRQGCDGQWLEKRIRKMGAA